MQSVSPPSTQIRISNPVVCVELNALMLFTIKNLKAPKYHGKYRYQTLGLTQSKLLSRPNQFPNYGPIEEVENFIGGIEDHITQHFKIKFQMLPITSLNLEIGLFHNEGKIKVLSMRHVHTVLAHLSCLAVEQLDWKQYSPSSDTTPTA
ncbi:uncharacterized protein LOC143448597 [Clavelina lepadiformis]|uniref:uncharacterized protein LOC143448576 n=1 Tax=Clavelina lepadiformis TaxID=159417 RepID=UPI0040420908